MTASTRASRFAAALSTVSDTRQAAREACDRARSELVEKVHLAIVFASMHHQDEFVALAEALAREMGADCTLGCTGESILCNGQEIERQPALAVWLAHLPGVELVPMHLEFQSTGDGGSFVGWPDRLSEPQPGESMLLVGEPFTFPADVLLARLADDRPAMPVFGGMASGGWAPGQNRLLLDDREITTGAVGLAMRGRVAIRNVVSQGCRPIGRPFVVTKATRNVIHELGGTPAMAALKQVFAGLSSDEQRLAQQGLHVGQVINEYQENFGRGDFLVRNVQGVEPESGAIAIGDYVRVGQTVQFHVRDAQTADEDLDALLTTAGRTATSPARGALVFTCNGRGTRLFDQPHHDAQAVARHANDIPTAGFFAQGEIGPIGGKNFLHGFTASIALFD